MKKETIKKTKNTGKKLHKNEALNNVLKALAKESTPSKDQSFSREQKDHFVNNLAHQANS
jgi:hypothetical protein